MALISKAVYNRAIRCLSGFRIGAIGSTWDQRPPRAPSA